MRKLTYLIILLSALFFTACFEIEEHVFLNKDGSGKYEMTFDMSEMMSNPFMKDAMLENMKKENPDFVAEVDSTSYFIDSEDNQNLTTEEKTIMKDAVVHMKMSAEKEQMIVSIKMPFNSIDHLNKQNEIMAKSNSSDDSPIGMMGDSPLMMNVKYKLEKKMLTRLPASSADMPETSDEDMEMMKMLLSDAKMTTYYHLPGKVKSTSIVNAQIHGKELKIVTPLLDIMEGNYKPDGSIKFKKN